MKYLLISLIFLLTTHMARSQCSYQYFNDTSIDPPDCAPCKTNCDTCSQLDRCDTCVTGTYFLPDSSGLCGTCADGYFGNKNNTQCQTCPQGCGICDMPTTNVQCTHCTIVGTVQYYLQDYLCVSTCTDGLYKVVDDAGQAKCLACSSNCNTCQNYDYECTSCGLLGGLASYLYSDKICYVTCPSKAYAEVSTNACVDCDSSCEGCTQTKVNCLKCANGFFRILGSNMCTQTCSFGQYQDTLTKTCKSCPSGCYQCSSSSVCSSCTVSYGVQFYLEDTACVAICSSGFQGFDPASNYAPKCMPCDATCLTCKNTATYCLSCKDSNKLRYDTNTCDSLCPSGEYDAGNGLCALCNANCKTCSTAATHCDSCGIIDGIQYYKHSDNVCYSVCPNGYYGEFDSLECKICDSSCDGCNIIATNCIKCKNSTYFIKVASNQCTSDCGSGYYGNTNTGKCTICPVGCNACSMAANAITCSSCKVVAGINYFLYNGNCYSVCPQTVSNKAQYGITTNLTCGLCDTSCKSCNGNLATNCLACPANSYLIYGTGQCLSSGCVEGQYAQTNSFICLLCPLACKTCSSATTCTSCGSSGVGISSFLYSGQCLMNCPVGYYGNTNNNSCTHCDNSCSKCYGGSSTNCIQCNSGSSIASNNTCISSCGNGYYSLNSVCKVCPTGCKTCTSGTSCSACATINGQSYYLNDYNCLLQCPVSTYPDAISNQCLNCSLSCATCQNSLACLTCPSGKYLIFSSRGCEDSCIAGQYNPANSYTCLPCDVACLTCGNNSSSYCLSCGLSATGLQLFLYTDNRCYQTCPSGYYGSITNSTCIGCGGTCDGCILSATNCIKCSSSNFRLVGSNLCGNCSDGYYGDSTTNLCTLCPTGCTTCTSATACLGCSSVAGVQYYLLNGSCLQICPVGMFGDKSGAAPVCTNCSSPCQSCSSLTACFKCSSGHVLSYGQQICQSSCLQGQYDDGAGKCQKCSIYCLSCINSTDNCQNCTTLGGVGYFLSGSSCIATCPNGTYANTSTQECSSCAQECSTCYGPLRTQCFACKTVNASIYYLEYGTTTCDLNCPSGQYKVDSIHQCLLCSSNCKTCQTNSTNCSGCGPSFLIGANFFFYNSSCLVRCPNGFWGNTSSFVCQTCASGCATCYGSELTQCNTCANVSGTIYYLQWGSNTCNTTCPSGSFISASVPFYCQLCSFLCVSCQGTADNCTSNCRKNYYFLNNSCLAVCPDNYFADPVVGQCVRCVTGCQSCFGADLLSCTRCQTIGNGTSYYLQISTTTCTLLCDSGEYGLNNKCYKCDRACASCTSYSSCSACRSVNGKAYFLSANSCIAQCPSHHYGQISNFSCVGCPEGCNTCYGSTLQECFSCTSDSNNVPYFLIYGTNTCTPQCPDGQYANSSSSTCMLCSQSCLTCTSSSTQCTSCGFSIGAQDLFLYSSKCLLNCPDGYWGNVTDHKCYTCSGGCALCTNIGLTSCSACKNDSSIPYYKYIDANTCGTGCPDGSFISAGKPNRCMACSKQCITCSVLADNCTNTNCSLNYFYQSGACLTQCLDNYFGNPSTRICTQCTDGCQSCFSPGLTSCTKCKALANSSNYFLQTTGTICGPSCPPGQYQNTTNLTCMPCRQVCKTCTSSTVCLSCQNLDGLAYFLQSNQCKVVCANGTYGETATNTCQNCAAGCKTCFGAAIDNCYSCNQSSSVNYYLIYNSYTCTQICPNGSYANATSFTCLLCSSTCLTCNFNSTYCTSCGLGAAGVPLYLKNNTCKYECPDGYYRNNSSYLCTSCDPACRTCNDGTKNYCFSCANVTNGGATTQYYLVIGSTFCDTQCSLGQFISASQPNNCQMCDDNCVGCSLFSWNCTQGNGCKANLFYNNASSSCVSTCPDGTFANPLTKFCQNCTDQCALCYGAVSSKCTKCKSVNGVNYFLQINQNFCTANCVTGEYGDAATLLCMPCSPACAICTNSALNCSSCQSVNGVAYFLQGTTCIISCPANKYGDTLTLQCTICANECYSCFGASSSECFNCANYNSADYFLVYSTTICDLNCPSNQYKNISSRQCLLCNPQCLTCQSNPNFCLSCSLSPFQAPLFFYNNQCLLTCPVKFWGNISNNNCDTCHAACTSCTSSGLNSCQSCGNISSTIYFKQIGADNCNTSCPDGQFIDASIPNLCQKCSPNCITCVNTSDTCTNVKCSNNYFYLNNSCLPQCPDNYFPDTSLRQCIQCTPGCQTCSALGLNSCNKCNIVATTQYYLQIGLQTCGPSCNPGQFKSALNNRCALCPEICSTCTSFSVCQSCNVINGVPYFLRSNACVPTCEMGEYGNINSLSCITCPSECLSCSAGVNSKCYTCSLGYFLIYGTTICNQTCPDGQYSNATSNQCLLCASQCITCVNTSSTCLTCGFSTLGSNFFLYGTQCLLRCPIGYWANNSTFTCSQCNAACLSCTDSSRNSCSTCGNISSTVYYKQIGATICSTTCPNGQYINANIPNFCQKCSSNCITCVNTSDTCTNLNCSKNYYYLNNTCRSQCPDNYFPDSSLRQCIQCTPGCQTCFALGLNSCTKCNSVSSTQYYLQLGLTSCASGCNPGQYPDSLTKQCTVCPQVCSICSTNTTCQSCKSLNGKAYFLSNNSCLFSCPIGQYGQVSNLLCLNCATGCSSCFAGDSNSCYSCKLDSVNGTATDFFLVQQTTICSTLCPDGQYGNKTSHTCMFCNINCKTCENTSTTCLSCGFSSIGANLYLLGNQCLQTCPDMYFSDKTTNQCVSCHLGCALCFGPSNTQCSKCKTQNISGVITPYYLYGNDTVCATSCPSGQFINPNLVNACISCDPGCLACSITSTNCTLSACSPGYYYYSVNSSCLHNCPDNFYNNNITGTCTQCPQGCLLCYGGQLTNCLSCQKTSSNVPYFKMMDVDTCTAVCDSGKWGQLSSFSCQYCSEQCLTCSGSATNCQSCKNITGVPYFNFNATQCLKRCYSGYFGQLSNNTCIACAIGCATCYGPNAQNCTSCTTYNSTVYYLGYSSTTCTATCIAGQYGIPSMNLCQKCDVNCFTCDKTAKNCTSCFLTKTGLRLYLQNNVCVQVCSIGTYSRQSDNTCQPCNLGCQICTGPSLSQCQACKNTTDPTNSSNTLVYYLNIGNSICSLQCPVGQYRRVGYPNICQACSLECIGCFGTSSNCTEINLCTLGYYFYRAQNSCLEKCPQRFYSDQVTKFCQPCASGCSACQQGDLNHCQSCKNDSSGLSFYKEIFYEWCVTDCLPGEYSVLSDHSCQPCDLTCALCMNSSTICQQCKNVSGVNYFVHVPDNACLKSCPDGLYGQTSNNTCVQCNPGCSLCFGPSTNECNGCRPDTTSTPATYYYLSFQTTICTKVCPYGQYAVNGTFTCELCNMNCATCEFSSTNCLSCTYIDSITIVYLFQTKCIIVCPDSYWPNSTIDNNHQCTLCHPYCSVCSGPSNQDCSSCKNATTTSQIYYLQINATICNPGCPNGQYVDVKVPNYCMECDKKCVRCGNSSTTCLQCSFGYYLYAPGNLCTSQCPDNYYNDPIITSNYYVCTQCTPGCKTCTGPSLNECPSCQNITNGTIVTAIYYKDTIGNICSTYCTLSNYFGNALTNRCERCAMGCTSCKFNSTYCFACKSQQGNDYFKTVGRNSCVAICPDGYYGNATDYQCHDCIYYTLQGKCVLTCPSGYFPQLNNSKTICQDCNDPSATGNPCNRSYTFTVQTKVIDSGESLQHKIYLPKGLSKNVTSQKLLTNLSVKIQQPSRRLLEEVQVVQVEEQQFEMTEVVEKISARMLIVSTPLQVKSLRISDDRNVIYIVTNYASADFSVANVVVDFPASSLVSSDGLLYQSTTASFALSNPIFQQSLFKVFSQDIRLGAQGIVFILLSLLLLTSQLIITNRKGYHEMVSFIMFLQVLGITRIREFPINFDVFSVLVGYSYFEMPFLPNFISGLFPASYQENSYEAVSFALGSQNLLINLCSIIEIILTFELCLFVYYVFKSDDPVHYARMKLYQQTLFVLFMVIILYDSILAVMSLQLNGILDLPAQYYASVFLSIIIVIGYLVYFIVSVRPYRLFELYKINNLFRVVGLAILPVNKQAGIVVITLVELFFFTFDIVFYRFQKLNLKMYVLQRLLVLVSLNISVFIVSSLSLLAVAGVCIAGVFGIKLYYSVITLKEYFDLKKQQEGKEIQVPSQDAEEAQQDIKKIESGQLQKKFQVNNMQELPTGINVKEMNETSAQIFYKQTMLEQQQSHLDFMDQTQQMKPDDSEQNKDESFLPKESESEISSNQIIYVEEDQYNQRLANKKRGQRQNRRLTQTRVGSRMGRRNPKVEGMRTATGFYVRQNLKRKNERIEEQIEVIQVQSRSDLQSDIVSEVSDGGWLAQKDEQTRVRALRNKTLWKIVKPEGDSR